MLAKSVGRSVSIIGNEQHSGFGLSNFALTEVRKRGGVTGHPSALNRNMHMQTHLIITENTTVHTQPATAHRSLPIVGAWGESIHWTFAASTLTILHTYFNTLSRLSVLSMVVLGQTACSAGTEVLTHTHTHTHTHTLILTRYSSSRLLVPIPHRPMHNA